jgi:hypothetical protein
LLFVCREVLKVDLGDMSHNVRARHGKRLPVVFSEDEVKALFNHVPTAIRVQNRQRSHSTRRKFRDGPLNPHLTPPIEGPSPMSPSNLVMQETYPSLAFP